MKLKLGFFIIFSLFVSLLLVSEADSLLVYLRPPRMTIRMNVTPGKYSTSQAFLEVKNHNNYTVNVEFIPQGDFVDSVAFDEESKFDLEPEEGRNVSFVVKLNQPGIYNETMLVTYLLEGENPVSLQADITIVANEVDGNNILKYSIIGFIVLVIIVIILFVFLKGGVKK